MAQKNTLSFWTRLGQSETADAPAQQPGAPPDLQPGEVAFGAVDGDWLVRIRPDGTVMFGGNYNPDVAVRAFWEALAAHHPNVSLRERTADDEARDLLARTLQELMVRIGRADLHNEAMQLRAQEEGATEHDRFRAEMARANLESIVHQTIDFARGVALTRPSN